MTDRLIRITTALAVLAVAVVAAIISYQDAYELVRSYGESGLTVRLLPFTVDGLIWAASMAVLDASRRNQPVPRLAACSLGAGIVATVGANLAHGVGHGPIGAVQSQTSDCPATVAAVPAEVYALRLQAVNSRSAQAASATTALQRCRQKHREFPVASAHLHSLNLDLGGIVRPVDRIVEQSRFISHTRPRGEHMFSPVHIPSC